MKISWDSKAEGVYIDLLCDKGEHSHTVEITDDILIDYNKQGEPTGIELQCVTKPEVEDITGKYTSDIPTHPSLWTP